MKTLALTLLSTLLLAGCATPLTPEQITAYNSAGQGVVHGVVGDYKTIKPLTK